jgi:penicillin-binding protein 1B
MLQDEPIELKLPHGALWEPKNYDKTPHGPVPLFYALAQSYNLATVRLGLDVGLNNVREIFRAAGMLADPPPLPSIFLSRSRRSTTRWPRRATARRCWRSARS